MPEHKHAILDSVAKQLGFRTDARTLADRDEVKRDAVERRDKGIRPYLGAHRAEIEVHQRRAAKELRPRQTRKQPHDPEAPIGDAPERNPPSLEPADDSPLYPDAEAQV